MGTNLSNKIGFKDLGYKLIARQNYIGTKFPGGKNLSAILLHRETHRLAEGKAVHRIGLQPNVMKEIEKDAFKNKKVILVAVEGKFIIKEEVDGELIIMSRESKKEALKEISSEINEQINNVL